MLTRAHLLARGCPPEMADGLKSAGFSWLELVLLAEKVGPEIWNTIAADRAAGKSWWQIVKDLVGLMPLTPPAPGAP